MRPTNQLNKGLIFVRKTIISLLTFYIFLFSLYSDKFIASAQERLFLDLSLELLDEYELPKQSFQNTQVGGLSAIVYDNQKDHYYVISDDRSNLDPARYYTLKINLDQNNSKQIKIKNIEIKNVTLLKNEQGKTYPQNSIDAEGIALSSRDTLFISSEGNTKKGIAPFIGEFDLQGNLQQKIRIPQRYLNNETLENLTKGIQNNLGFEALTVKLNGTVKEDAFRLFVGTEAALIQDVNPENSLTQNRSRLLNYVINPIGEPVLLGENLYILDSAPLGVISNGLTELVALEKEGYLLSLERTFGLSGAGAKIFQVIIANATDTSNTASLAGNIDNILPLKKKLVLNLKDLGIELDNLEGMTLGPKLKDGSQTLILISDDNFTNSQKNQFLLFKLYSN
jgi:hypothetical protein